MNGDTCCPPPDGADDPAFLRALELDAVAALVGERLLVDGELRGLRPDYVRWKDRDGSLLGYRTTVRTADGDRETYVTARTAAPHRLADEAARLQHRTDEQHSGLRAFAFLPEADLLLLSFPIDRALGDLRRFVRASKVKALIAAACPELVPAGRRILKKRSRCHIVRYKPERRAVLHWDLALVADDGAPPARRSLWLRCYSAPQAARTGTATAAAAAAGVRCPRPLAVPHDRLLLESHLDGTTWQPGTTGDAGGRAAAQALGRLHGAALAPALPHHGPLDELDLVLRAAEDLARLRPGLGRLAAAVTDQLAHRVPIGRAMVLSHGDMHPGQVLLATDGGDAGLCDFDRARIAPAALDLASMFAHGIANGGERGEAAARRFWSDYAFCRPLPAAAELHWWCACALVRAATTPFRALRPDWPAAAESLLHRAAALLAGTGQEARP